MLGKTRALQQLVHADPVVQQEVEGLAHGRWSQDAMAWRVSAIVAEARATCTRGLPADSQ